MKTKDQKENKGNKKIIVILSVLLGLIILVALAFLIMYLRKPKYEIKVNTNGHKIIKNIKMKGNKIEELPEIKLDKDEDFVAWVNKDNEAMRPKIELGRDEEITPITIPSKSEKVTLKFVTRTSEKIPDITIEKGSPIIFPVKPTHKAWTFICWVDKNGFIVLQNTIVNEDMTLYAHWFESNRHDVTISFDTGTDEVVKPITLVQGDTIIFPTLKKNKEGYVFKGWMNKDGNLLDNTYRVSDDMKLTAKWEPNYTCPDNCIPNSDGKTCTRTLTVNPTTKKVCEGTLWHGYCLDFNNKESGAIRQCAAMGNDESDEVWYTTDTEDWCVKKKAWTESQVCPSGYEMAATMCSKEEVLNCTAN